MITEYSKLVDYILPDSGMRKEIMSKESVILKIYEFMSKCRNNGIKDSLDEIYRHGINPFELTPDPRITGGEVAPVSISRIILDNITTKKEFAELFSMYESILPSANASNRVEIEPPLMLALRSNNINNVKTLLNNNIKLGLWRNYPYDKHCREIADYIASTSSIELVKLIHGNFRIDKKTLYENILVKILNKDSISIKELSFCEEILRDGAKLKSCSLDFLLHGVLNSKCDHKNMLYSAIYLHSFNESVNIKSISRLNKVNLISMIKTFTDVRNIDEDLIMEAIGGEKSTDGQFFKIFKNASDLLSRTTLISVPLLSFSVVDSFMNDYGFAKSILSQFSGKAEELIFSGFLSVAIFSAPRGYLAARKYFKNGEFFDKLVESLSNYGDLFYYKLKKALNKIADIIKPGNNFYICVGYGNKNIKSSMDDIKKTCHSGATVGVEDKLLEILYANKSNILRNSEFSTELYITSCHLLLSGVNADQRIITELSSCFHSFLTPLKYSDEEVLIDLPDISLSMSGINFDELTTEESIRILKFSIHYLAVFHSFSTYKELPYLKSSYESIKKSIESLAECIPLHYKNIFESISMDLIIENSIEGIDLIGDLYDFSSNLSEKIHNREMNSYVGNVF